MGPRVRAGRPEVQGSLALMMIAQPRVNAAAWFALAVAAPAALLAIAAAATAVGAPRMAGFWAAMLLAPAVVLALRSLETRDFEEDPRGAREQDLVRAFCLTTGQACGLLLVVLAGAPFSGQSVAVGLAMASCPLALAVVSHIWRQIFPPLEETCAPSLLKTPVSSARQWSEAWSEADRLQPVVRGPAPRAPAVPSEAVAVRMTGGVEVRTRRESLAARARDRALLEIAAEADFLQAAAEAPAQPQIETLADRLERELGPRVRAAFEAPPLQPVPLRSRPYGSAPSGSNELRPIRLCAPPETAAETEAADWAPEPRRAVAGR